MDFIKIAICDDEKNIRAYLSSLVRKQGAECEIAEYASADEYLLDQTEYDLLFLDIELDGAASSKHRVLDTRFDYIETGSLISIKKNVKDIMIPSEEHPIQMYPMDFEEFL